MAGALSWIQPNRPISGTGTGTSLWDTSAMNQIDADRFDELAETYSTQADQCSREAEGPLDPWALLAAAWTKLAEETKARSRGSRPS